MYPGRTGASSVPNKVGQVERLSPKQGFKLKGSEPNKVGQVESTVYVLFSAIKTLMKPRVVVVVLLSSQGQA